MLVLNIAGHGRAEGCGGSGGGGRLRGGVQLSSVGTYNCTMFHRVYLLSVHGSADITGSLAQGRNKQPVLQPDQRDGAKNVDD